MGVMSLLARPLVRRLRKDPRRRVALLVLGTAWRVLRRSGAGRRRQELVYRTTLRSGRRLDLTTSDALPRRLGSRRLRRRVAEALRAEAGR